MYHEEFLLVIDKKNQYYAVIDTLSYMYYEVLSFADHNGKISDSFMKDNLRYFIWHSSQRNLRIIFLLFKIIKKDFESAFHLLTVKPIHRKEQHWTNMVISYGSENKCHLFGLLNNKILSLNMKS